MSKSTSQEKRWVIIFLIYADFVETHGSTINDNFLAHLDNLCQDLLQCKLGKDKFSVYVIFSKVDYFKESTQAGTFAPTSSTFLYQLKPGVFNKNDVVLIKHSASVQTLKDLTGVFDEIVTTEKEAGHNNLSVMLSPWDHGMPFGIFRIGDALNPVMKRHTWDHIKEHSSFFSVNQFLNAATSRFVITEGTKIKGLDKDRRKSYFFQEKAFRFIQKSDERKFLRDASLAIEIIPSGGNNAVLHYKPQDGSPKPLTTNIELTPNDLLSNEELAIAMYRSFGKVDVLFMMNCCTMNIDTLCWFSGVVDYFIAPPTSIDFPVYNYRSILNFIHTSIDKGTLSAELLASHCLSSINSNDRQGDALNTQINNCAVFGFDLRKKEGQTNFPARMIANRVDLFLAAILKDKDTNPDVKSFLKYAAAYSYHFDDRFNTCPIDIVNWVRNMMASQGLKKIVNPNILADFVDEMVGDNGKPGLIKQLKGNLKPHIGDNWFSEAKGGVVEHDPSGITAYLPSRDFDQVVKASIANFFTRKETKNPSVEGFSVDGFYVEHPLWLELLHFVLA
jgi:hypothetical protein